MQKKLNPASFRKIGLKISLAPVLQETAIKEKSGVKRCGIKLEKIGGNIKQIDWGSVSFKYDKKVKLEKIEGGKNSGAGKSKLKVKSGIKIKKGDLAPIGDFSKKQKNPAGKQASNGAGKKIRLRKALARQATKQKSQKLEIGNPPDRMAVIRAGWKLNQHIGESELKASKRRLSDDAIFNRHGVSKKIVSDRVILDDKAGEEFVLRNLRKTPSQEVSRKLEQLVIGMPEAGKKEPWNFIRLNGNKCLETENEAAYILDDFDTLEELKKEPFNYGIKKEQYAASPYIVDLGQSQKNNKTIKQENKIRNWNKKFIVILFYCYIVKLLKKGFSPKAADQPLAEEIRKPAPHFIAGSLSKDWKLEIGNFLKNCGNGFKKLSKLRNSFSDIFTIKRQALATAVNFSIIALLLVLPIYSIRYYVKARNTKGKVLGAAYEAISNLKLGKELLEIDLPREANIKFDEAKGGFEIAEESLNEINNIVYNAALKVFNKDSEVESARALIKAGEKTAEISKLISEGLNSSKLKVQSSKLGEGIEGEEGSNKKLEIGPSNTAGKNWKLAVGVEGEKGEEDVENCRDGALPCLKGGNLMDIVRQFNNTAEKVLPKLEELKNYLSLVDMEAVPDEYKEEIGRAFEMAGYIEYKLADCVKYTKTIAGILAEGSSARYLLVFQNNSELRATGGFIGSYSLVDIKNGEIVNFEIPEQGSYALQGGLLSNIEPPNALQLINGRWEFQDANWWPDFPRSAEYLSDVYEKSGGPTVDGVIAINASFMEDLLGIIGEIEMPAYNKTITAANFMDETQKSVELEYDKKGNKPKKIIADMMPLAIAKIFGLENEKLLDAISIFNRALSKRDILIYSADNALEAKIKNLGWGGEIKNIENRDYLAVFDTNLGGRKTDGVIDQYFTHNTEVADDGAITDELIIIKKHNGIKGDYFEGVNNVDYLRIYVPLGSMLLEAEGFDPPPEDCYKELREDAERNEYLAFVEGKEKEDIETGTIIGENFGKTYFANWTQVDPGEEITVRIKYRLPFRLFDNSATGSGKIGKYSLYMQKQPGSRDHAITKNLYLPDNLKSAWAYPGIGENGKWVEFDKLESDKFYGGIFVN